jgi:hypothetical protein
MIFLWERCCTASCLWKSYNIFMKNNTYTNFNEEKVDEDIVMGVPVNLAPGQLANPCFPQLPPNFVGIHPQTYHHNQNAALHQINALPGIPPSVGANQQPFPQLQSQYRLLYLGCSTIANRLTFAVHVATSKSIPSSTMSQATQCTFGRSRFSAASVHSALVSPSPLTNAWITTITALTVASTFWGNTALSLIVSDQSALVCLFVKSVNFFSIA